MLFDTDILIWIQKGNQKAASTIERSEKRFISIQTYMELMQCAQNKSQQRVIKNFISSYEFRVLPLTENIGHRASIYVEEYSLSTGLRAGDAIIAATATENDMELMTGNQKHFKGIKDLRLKIFKV